MKKMILAIVCLLLIAACGQSYEETKRIKRQQQREAMRKDSAMLKVAVMPTLDCLPLYVARQEQLFDTIHGGVLLRVYQAQMDCDSAFLRGHVEGMVTDLVRAKRIEEEGIKVRYAATTNAYWQLVANRNARIRQSRQLTDKMVAMTRFSATDMLTEWTVNTARLKPEHVYKVQINDVNIRLQMLQNNEMDALWVTEPQATMARMMKHPVIMDSRDTNMSLGVMAFNEMEMRRQARAKQLDLLMRAYNQACDSINKYGLKYYRNLISRYCQIKQEYVDSLPTLTYQHAQGPRQQDVTAVEKWLKEVKPKKDKK